MKTIPLSKGKVAIVDDDMYDYLNQWKWYCNTLNRAVRTTGDGKNQKMFYMHRVVMNAPGGMEVDHINMNGLDNRRENLRLATRAQNSANKKKYSTNTSGYKGVTWNKTCGKWEANITINYKNNYLGLFEEIKDAAQAYNRAALERMGNFARPNEVQSG